MSHSAGEPGKPTDFLLLSCEHGGNDVPPAYAHLFRDTTAALATHRGYDIGALGVAQRVASQLAAPILFSTTTRLLIDLNRSLDNPTLFSEFSAVLSADEQSLLIDQFYRPYHDNITRLVTAAIDAGHRVVHVGIHSCTDVLDGVTRDLDLALLFDEARPEEASFCERWEHHLRQSAPQWRHRFNQPYRGSDDGLTTSLRQHFPPDRYLGLEVEIRQGLLDTSQAQTEFGNLISQALADAMT